MYIHIYIYIYIERERERFSYLCIYLLIDLSMLFFCGDGCFFEVSGWGWLKTKSSLSDGDRAGVYRESERNGMMMIIIIIISRISSSTPSPTPLPPHPTTPLALATLPLRPGPPRAIMPKTMPMGQADRQVRTL